MQLVEGLNLLGLCFDQPTISTDLDGQIWSYYPLFLSDHPSSDLWKCVSQPCHGCLGRILTWRRSLLFSSLQRFREYRCQSQHSKRSIDFASRAANVFHGKENAAEAQVLCHVPSCRLSHLPSRGRYPCSNLSSGIVLHHHLLHVATGSVTRTVLCPRLHSLYLLHGHDELVQIVR